jgi:hypothetical protein
MKALLCFVLSSQIWAQTLVVMTHVQSEYDPEARLKQHIEKLLSKLSSSKKIILYNNLETWNGPSDAGTEELYSKFGEHHLSAQTVYLTGAQMGACLQYTIRDFLKYRSSPLSIVIDAQTVMTIEGELLSERLQKTTRADWNTLLYEYFSRMIFNEKSKKVRKAKINLFLNDILIGAIRSSFLASPHIQPDLQIKVYTP